ncbi:MAG: holo-ACP synthase [Acidimicrobiales bacterium]
MSPADPVGPLSATLAGAARELAARSGLAGTVVGVGVDAVDVDRFRRVLGRRTRLADRLFTGGERSYAGAASDPVPRLSTRFAAKEATMKALGVGLGAFPFTDVEVVRHGLDAPSLVLHRSALELAEGAGVLRWHLSLTHTDQVAMAVVVAEGGGRGSEGAGERAREGAGEAAREGAGEAAGEGAGEGAGEPGPGPGVPGRILPAGPPVKP